MTGIDELHPSLQHHIVNTLGWRTLRPLQAAAVAPVLAGHDALLLAPTAGGKTEAATMPLLTRLVDESWGGLSVLYLCPLKALLNNLQPRLDEYAGWVGRRVATRHGDTRPGERRRQLADPPAILLTTPESVEAMLTSRLVDAATVFAEVRAVVVDEVHAFAGDDRGWHLLAVLDRIEQITGRPLQRIGLSATVGNPDELLAWLQGGSAGTRPATVVAPPAAAAAPPELTLDYVGSAANAAQVVARLHRGEKRLVFCDSRKTVEDVAGRLRDHDVDAFVSHSSLSHDERRRAETAFADARDCVIVSTSTLELGIDVGDLDRVLQVGAPTTVASVLQRLGRTGRRPGTARSMTFLALDDTQLLRAAGLLHLHAEGYVEPVTAPPAPLHVAAQQLLAATLQHGRIDLAAHTARLHSLGLGSADDLAAIGTWMLDNGYLDTDSGLAHLGPTAEKRYCAKHFLELLAVFSTPPEITALHGLQEIGTLDPMLLLLKVDGPRVVALAGRAWTVTHIDWTRRRCFVEPTDGVGRALWSGSETVYSYELAQAIRRVLLGTPPTDVTLSTRATTRLAALRKEYLPRVRPDATVIRQESTDNRWWTFAGMGLNAVLVTALDRVAPHLLDDGRFDNLSIAVRDDATSSEVGAALREIHARHGPQLDDVTPHVDDDDLTRLTFHELLPPHLARATLAARLRPRPIGHTPPPP